MATLKDLQQFIGDRVPVILAGNPYRVRLPFVTPGDKPPIGSFLVGDDDQSMARLYTFDFAVEPVTMQADIPLDEILPVLPGTEAPYPSLTQVGALPLKVIKQVRVSLEVIVDEDPVDYEVISAETFHVIRGGIGGEKRMKYGQNYLTDGLNASMSFLTHQPLEKPVLEDQPDFLYYLHNFDSPQVLRLAVIYRTVAGATTTLYPYSFQADTYGLYCLPVGPAQLGLPDTAVSFEVALINPADQRFTAVRTHYIDRNAYEESSVLFFENSFGLFDSVALFGYRDIKASYEAENSRLLNAPQGQPQNRTSKRDEKITTTYRTGRYPPGWPLYFSELVRSRRLAVLKGGTFYHARVESGDADLENTYDPAYSVQVQLSSEFSESYYQF